MNEQVKRFDYGYKDDGCGGARFLGLIEKPDGALVRHSDYAALEAECDKLRAQVSAQQSDPWAPSGADYDRAIHRNPDAKAWADFFVSTFPGQADKHELMIGWFANAMMAMHDYLKAQQSAPELLANLLAVTAVKAEQVPTPEFVWVRLLEALHGDNGGAFTASTDDYREAKPALVQLIAAGFFRDDADSLDGDIWAVAAGEQGEAAARFASCPDAYAVLSDVLNRVFDRPDEAPSLPAAGSADLPPPDFTLDCGSQPCYYAETVQRIVAALSAQTAPQGLRIVLDGPPGPEAGRFVEVENAAGRSVNAGEWRERADGLWELVLHAAQGGE